MACFSLESQRRYATLRGLRAHTALAARQSGVISAFVRERVRVAEIHRDPNGSRRLREANRWKLARPPEESEQCLIRFANPIESRRGLYHGDLHCGNVMVRGRDAIVIDFGSMDDQGPITADAAFLEVSLVFGVDERDVDDSFDEWRDFVDELYIRQSPVVPPIHDAEHIRYAWLRKAVRELRHIGSCCGGSLDESKTVLAACLLRFARLSASEFSSPALVELSERRRAYAIVIGEKKNG